jgi:hypothetical protein
LVCGRNVAPLTGGFHMAKVIGSGCWLLVAVLIGCAGADGNEDGGLESIEGDESSEAAELGGLQQSLRTTVGGTRAGYTCSGLKCTCTGDDDCNDMFEDGVCGDVTSCDTTDPLNPKCECLILKVKQVPRTFVISDAVTAVFAR